MKSEPLYDDIGATYGITRRADPQIAQAIAGYAGVRAGGTFLDVGCGTGNYTCMLAGIGGQWHGTDISGAMLEQARAKRQDIAWTRADAAAMPFADRTFDGAICTLAIHHFARCDAPFREVARVLKAGPFVLFTAFPAQMRNYWLCHYFPRMMQRSIAQMPAQDVVAGALRGAGFEVQEIVPFHITRALKDLFLYCGKNRPELYLDPAVRANISSFARLCPPDELQSGLGALALDIRQKRIGDIMRGCASASGDYAYVIARKVSI